MSNLAILPTLEVSKSETPMSATITRQNISLWSNLRQVCELLLIEVPARADQDTHRFQHLRIKAGQSLYRTGQDFDTLFLINSGFVKTVHIDEHGTEHVLSFPMKGDVLGTDGIHTLHYASDAIALCDCDIILLPYKTLAKLTHTYLELETALYSLMSREIVREQALISMLSALSAEAKVARFLVKLGERFMQLGYSSRQFNLRMTRQEIGSYLGLTLETVSRTLSALHEQGLIRVEQREIQLCDIPALKKLRRFAPNKAKQKVADTVSTLVNNTLRAHWNSELASA